MPWAQAGRQHREPCAPVPVPRGCLRPARRHRAGNRRPGTCPQQGRHHPGVSRGHPRGAHGALRRCAPALSPAPGGAAAAPGSAPRRREPTRPRSAHGMGRVPVAAGAPCSPTPHWMSRSDCRPPGPPPPVWCRWASVSRWAPCSGDRGVASCRGAGTILHHWVRSVANSPGAPSPHDPYMAPAPHLCWGSHACQKGAGVRTQPWGRSWMWGGTWHGTGLTWSARRWAAAGGRGWRAAGWCEPSCGRAAAAAWPAHGVGSARAPAREQRPCREGLAKNNTD